MNSGAGRLAWQRPATSTRFASAGGAAARAGIAVPGTPGLPRGTAGAAGTGAGIASDRPHRLGALTRYVAARHVLVMIALLFFPVVATPFFTYQIAAQSLILGTIALSLTFLGGYGGMISLAQMTVAGVAGYTVAILGVNGTPEINVNWPWWAIAPIGVLLAVLASTLIGWLSVRTEGIYTIMITLAIAAAFFYFERQNYTIFNGYTGFANVVPPELFGVNWRQPVPFYYLSLGCAAAAYLDAARASDDASLAERAADRRTNPARARGCLHALRAGKISGDAFAHLVRRESLQLARSLRGARSTKNKKDRKSI